MATYMTWAEADRLVKDYYGNKGIPFDINRYTADVRALEGGRMAPTSFGYADNTGSNSGSGQHYSFNYNVPEPPEPYPWLMDTIKSRIAGNGIFDNQVYNDTLNTIKETAGLNYQQGRDSLQDDLARGNIDPNSGPALAQLAKLQTEMGRDITNNTRGLNQYKNDAIQEGITNAMGTASNVYGTEMSGYGPYASASTNAAIAGYQGILAQMEQEREIQAQRDAALFNYMGTTNQARLEQEYNQPDWSDYLGLGVNALSALYPFGTQASWMAGNPTALSVTNKKKSKYNNRLLPDNCTFGGGVVNPSALYFGGK